MSDPQAFRAIYETHHAAVCGAPSGARPDQTYVEEIVDFDTLPDTPANRRLLALQ